MSEMQRLLFDLWVYATGESFGEMDEDDAEREGSMCAELYRRVKAAIEKEQP